MSGAHGLVRGPGAGAEVELLYGETLVTETDVVRPTGRPILDVSQVGVSIDHHVSTTKQTQGFKAQFTEMLAWHTSWVSGVQMRKRTDISCIVLLTAGNTDTLNKVPPDTSPAGGQFGIWVPAVKRSAMSSDWERGQPPLQLSQSWGWRDVGAQQVPAVNIPETQRWDQWSQRAKSGDRRAAQGFRKDSLTVCYTGSRCPCPCHSFLSPSLRCSTSHNRTCQLLLPLRETQKSWEWPCVKQVQISQYNSRLHLLSPQMYLHCLSLVLHRPLKQRPCGETHMCRTEALVLLFFMYHKNKSASVEHLTWSFSHV